VRLFRGIESLPIARELRAPNRETRDSVRDQRFLGSDPRDVVIVTGLSGFTPTASASVETANSGPPRITIETDHS
jgi:hypothetical protein